MSTVKVKLKQKLHVLYVKRKKKGLFVYVHVLISIKKFEFGNFGTGDQSCFSRLMVEDDNQLKEYIGANFKATSRKCLKSLFVLKKQS